MTPNDVFNWLFKRKITPERIAFTKIDGQWHVVVVANIPDQQFQYSIGRRADTLADACKDMIEALEEKEWR